MAHKPRVTGFLVIFALLEDGVNTTPQLRLERLATLPLGERPPLVVYLEAPEPHIHVLWGAQFMTLSFLQPTLEDGKALAFAKDIHLGLLPATGAVHPECITPEEVAGPQEADMETLLARLSPGHLRLPPDTPRTDRVSVPRTYLAPLSLVHPLMVSPFLAPATVWHMMHTKANTMGMT